jgi:hypothetical protein
MIKNALEYLVSLKPNQTYQIDDYAYSDHELHRIDPPRYYKKTLSFGSLDAIVKMIRNEIEDYRVTEGGLPVFIQVAAYNRVEVFTRPDLTETREFPYNAICDDADFQPGWRTQDKAIIELKSRFLPTADTEYLIDLISRINNDQGVRSEDNGVSQTVTVKSGISLMSTEKVKPRLALQPFRTFREVDQPVSEFILRLDEQKGVGIFEADGGIWKMEAKDNIQKYFEEKLAQEISEGEVVVMV